MKNLVKTNTTTKSTFSNFLKVGLDKKQTKSVKGGADIVIEDLLGS